MRWGADEATMLKLIALLGAVTALTSCTEHRRFTRFDCCEDSRFFHRRDFEERRDFCCEDERRFFPRRRIEEERQEFCCEDERRFFPRRFRRDDDWSYD
jgi:hypothetical protein